MGGLGWVGIMYQMEMHNHIIHKKIVRKNQTTKCKKKCTWLPQEQSHTYGNKELGQVVVLTAVVKSQAYRHVINADFLGAKKRTRLWPTNEYTYLITIGGMPEPNMSLGVVATHWGIITVAAVELSPPAMRWPLLIHQPWPRNSTLLHQLADHGTLWDLVLHTAAARGWNWRWICWICWIYWLTLDSLQLGLEPDHPWLQLGQERGRCFRCLLVPVFTFLKRGRELFNCDLQQWHSAKFFSHFRVLYIYPFVAL